MSCGAHYKDDTAGVSECQSETVHLAPRLVWKRQHPAVGLTESLVKRANMGQEQSGPMSARRLNIRALQRWLCRL